MWPGADYYEVVVGKQWKVLFHLDSVAPDDDFVELGGTSLGAVVVAAGLAEELGRPVPASLVMKRRTPTALAAALRESMGVPVNGLVELRRGDEPTVVAIHPVGGGVIWYQELADALAPMSCTGVQSLGLAGGRIDYPDIGAVADEYLEQIRDARQLGHTLLAGYSWGGLVAFEMACRAVASGCPPLGLVLFDAVVPAVAVDRGHLLWSISCHALGLDVDPAELVGLDQEELAAHLAAAQRRSNGGRQEVDESRMGALLATYAVNVRLQEEYEPAGRYSGDALFVRPSRNGAPGAREFWSARCARMSHAVVRAEHGDMLAGAAARAAAAFVTDRWLATGEQAQLPAESSGRVKARPSAD
jgi:thioesterase domain-containing protein/acyl carrier protein